MTSQAGRTCMPCRFRKVKCDGKPEKCGPCSRARRTLNCTYNEAAYIESEARKEPLRRGEACLPCRKKKKRCNAVRPCCDTCHTAGKELECVYRDTPSANRNIKYTPTSGFVSTIHKTDTMSAYSDTDSSYDSISFLSGPFTHVPPASVDRKYRLASTSPSVSSTRMTPVCQTTIHESRIHLPPLVYSEVSPTDVDFKFRHAFLSHRVQASFCFPSAKQQAILQGDLSNTVIHPFFIRFATMFGCNLYSERRKDYIFASNLDVYIRLAWEAIASMAEEDDPLSFAQAHQFMSLACIYNHDLSLGRQLLKEAVRIVRRNNIRFVPSQDFYEDERKRATSLPEKDHERISFLSELIFSEVYIKILSGDADWEMSSDLHHQFLKELSVSYPHAYRICPITARAACELFVIGTVRIIASYKHQSMPTSSWFSSCQDHLLMLTIRLPELSIRMEELKRAGDHSGCASLWFSIYACLCKLSEMNRILERHPLSLDSQVTCREALAEVSKLMEGIDQKEILFLDQFYQVCWHRATNIFGSEVSVLTKCDPSSPPWPQAPSESIFWNSSIITMSQCQDKLSVIPLHDGSVPFSETR